MPCNLEKIRTEHITACAGFMLGSLFFPEEGVSMFLQNALLFELYGIKMQKTILFMVTAVRTSD
jgi:hypothetical protein